MRVLPIAVLVLAAGPAFGADLLLKRVMLSSAGVGYFEYEAEVDGPAVLGLDVKLDQVDDVLKSMVVFDDSGGVGGIELPGREQSHAAFGDVPFGPEGLASPLAFLNSLQGVEVTVEGPRPMAGRILRAEAVREPVAGPGQAAGVSRTRVSVLTAEGLKQFVLEEADSVQVADAGLRTRIGRALAASRQESARDARHLTIRSSGAGRRTIRVSYVAVAPLWKASYRLVLPAADADPATARARLQGWATFENETGADWSDVAVTVQYGNPVTFRQAIYRSYFVTRPEVPVEVLGRLLPDVDSRAREAAPEPAAPKPAPSPAPSSAAGMPEGELRRMRPAPMAAPPPRPIAMAGMADATLAQEGAEETVFTIAAPVSLAAGHSASVPILDAVVPGERLSFASESGASESGGSHPLAAVRLVNASATSLPAGVLTLYDGQGTAPYAGDARLGGVPAGESRLVAYAQDLRTEVTWRWEEGQTVAALTAANGVVSVTKRDRRVGHATVTAPAREKRRVLLEVAKGDGARLAPGFMAATAETATGWRFAVDLQPGEVREVTVAVDRDTQEQIAVLDDEASVATVLGLQGLDDGARAALGRIEELRAQEAARTAEQERLGTQREAVEADEERVRSNLAAVKAGDALRGRLLRQLETDEARLGQLQAAVELADAAVAKAHQALVDAIGRLRI